MSDANVLKIEPLAIYGFDTTIVLTNKMRFIDFVFDYKSIKWQEKLNDYASCELWARLTPKNIASLRPSNIVYRDRKHCFYITSVEYTRDADNNNLLHAKGYTLNYLLTFRVLNGAYRFKLSDNTSTVVRTIVNKMFLNPDDTNRKSFCMRYEDEANITSGYGYTKTGNTMLEAMQEIVSRYDMLSFEMWFDATPTKLEFVFRLFNGKTSTQNSIYFSDVTSDIISSSLTVDENAVANYIYVYGEDKDAQRKSVAITVDGYDYVKDVLRKELYVDARDLQSEVYNPDGEQEIVSDEEYRRMLTNRGNDKALQYGKKVNYTANLRDNKLHKYGIDYDYGDLVSVNDAIVGAVVVEKVTGYEETESATVGKTYNITVGQQKITLKESIKRML